jgi:hypothetical protein
VQRAARVRAAWRSACIAPRSWRRWARCRRASPTSCATRPTASSTRSRRCASCCRRRCSIPTTGVGDLIDVIEQCAEQVAYVSRQLLGFRRSGDLELRPVADRRRRQPRARQRRRGAGEVRLKTELAYTGIIRCAAPLLTQVLVNLLENAAQAAGPGGWVTIGTTNETEDRVCIEVSDSGPGVPLALQSASSSRSSPPSPPARAPGSDYRRRVISCSDMAVHSSSGPARRGPRS